MSNQASGILSPWLRKQRIKIVALYLGNKILDYGCGIGALAEICRGKGYLGVDIDKESIDIARRQYPDLQFAYNIPVDEQFDTVVMLAVIEHIKEPIGLLRQVENILKPEGQVLITTPHPCVDAIYNFGSKIGLFSPQACEEHEHLFDYNGMSKVLNQTGLIIQHYRRFLCGANQLFVLEHK